MRRLHSGFQGPKTYLRQSCALLGSVWATFPLQEWTMTQEQYLWRALWKVTQVLLVTGGTAWAQNAVVSGRISDTSGGVIANVSVELTNHATQVKSATRTNNEGIFVFP